MQEELRFLQKKFSGKLTYDTYYTMCKKKYETQQNLNARKIWEEVEIPNYGNLRGPDWKVFRIRFLTAKMDVHDATDQEAYRLLRDRVPGFMVNWLVEYEEKQRHQNFSIQVSNLPRATPKSLEISLRKMFPDIVYLRVLQLGSGIFKVIVEKEEDAAEVLQLAGKSPDGGVTI